MLEVLKSSGVETPSWTQQVLFGVYLQKVFSLQTFLNRKVYFVDPPFLSVEKYYCKLRRGIGGKGDGRGAIAHKDKNHS